MLHDQFNVGAYWGDRRESLDECGRRATHFFERIASHDQAFAHWKKTGATRKAAESNFLPTFEALREALARGRNRRDSDKSVIEDLGYNSSFWNRDSSGAAARLSIFCGAYPRVADLPVPNNCLIEIPSIGLAAERLLKPEKLCSLVKTFVITWDPDWVRVTSTGLLDILFDRIGTQDMVGWITYFSGRYGPIPALPADYDVFKYNDLGTIITVRLPDRFSSSDENHVEAIKRLATILADEGILRRTPGAAPGQ